MRFSYQTIVRNLALTVVPALSLMVSNPSYSQGTLPVPTMDDVGLTTGVSVGTGPTGFPEYTYEYTVQSGAANDGLIWMFSVDVSTNIPGVDGGETYPIRGGNQTSLWSDDVSALEPFLGLHGSTVLRVTQLMPLGWNGGVGRDGFAIFAASGEMPLVGPGESLAGFQMISHQPPTIRDATIIPQWYLLVDDLEADVEPGVTGPAAFDTEDNLRTELAALGPGRSGFSAFALSNKLREDLTKALQLGWVTDTNLSATLISDLESGIAALQAQDGDLAKTFFQSMLDTILAADPAGFRTEYRPLVELNLIEMIRLTPTTPIPFEPEFSFETNAGRLSIGETFVITVRYVNAANNDEPISGFTFRATCESLFSCANFDGGRSGLLVTTDVNGEATISVEGLNPGVDRIALGTSLEVPDEFGIARVEWTGGPDLVVPEFIPPIIEAEAGETIFVTDSTMNQGNLPSAESVTRYYISDTDPIDIATAEVIGERVVNALEPGEVSSSVEIPFTIPTGFVMGFHYMAACADADSLVTELDENNNCSFSELETVRVISVPASFQGFASIFSVGDASIIEGGAGSTSLEFSVSIDMADPNEEVSVNYSTVDGTATVADGDYAAQNGLIVFPAGTSEFTQVVTVPVFGDIRIEEDETLSIVLSNPMGLSDIGDGTGFGTIINDDKATIQISDASVTEGDSGTTVVSFDVNIDQSDPIHPITVTASTQPGSATESVDYQAVSEVVTFPAGTAELTLPVQVEVLGDTLIELDETFSVVLSAPSNNAHILVNEASGTIIDDDSAVLFVGDVSVSEGDAGTVAANFELTLNQANPFADVTVTVVSQEGSASAGSDFNATNETVVFSPGSVSESVTVSVLGDNVVEIDETFSLAITDVSPNVTIGDGIGTGTIFDDDEVTIQVSDAETLEGDDINSSLSFTVSIDQSHPQNDILVAYQTQDGTASSADADFEGLVGSVVFPAGTTMLSQDVIVTVIADFDVEIDESLSLAISTSSDDAVIANAVGTGTITNDDLTAIQISDVVSAEGDSGTTPFTFTISIDQSHPTQGIDVDVFTQDGTAVASEDYLSTTGVVTFAPGTLQLSQQFVVPVNGDTDVEADETFSVVLGENSEYATLLDPEGVGQIENDDTLVTLNCDDAVATPNMLWPPNHKLVDIGISGVLDENDQEASIIVTSIFQDEVLNGEGDGNTSPDGFGVGTDTAQVRRERSGLGDGRIYFIGFDASSNSGATCSGEVAVGVPHDQGQGSTPIDSGLRIDSTGL